jgi:DNA polymerase-3 subunit alpha
MTDLVHLHVHSEFSLLDGLAQVKDLVRAVADLGQPAVALTDHGVMFGALHFYNAAKKVGIKPIIGIEMYISPRRMTEKEPKVDARSSHIVLLAENDTGYHNLSQIATAGQLEGHYYRPRVDKEYLAAHSEGLICLSGCGSGEIPRLIQDGRLEAAKKVARWYWDVFGPDRFYLELQEHDIPEMEGVNATLIALSRELGIPFVATNDVHYLRQDQAYAHEVLLCIGTGKTITEPERMRMNNDSYYLKSGEEMAVLFPDLPEALANSLRIAERCEVNLDPTGFHLPQVDVPPGYTPRSYLRHLVEAGLRDVYGGAFHSQRVQNRMEYELDIIHQMGFDAYFLIVWDLCRFSRERDIWWNVRGSAAGSIVARGLGITNLDPLEHGLIFERFLNPDRVSMPDIDLDFPDNRRSELIDYTVNKYGADRVAQIITFGTLGARAAVRDVGRALDIPLTEVDAIARLIPTTVGQKLQDALDQVPEIRQLYEGEEYVRQLIDTALQLEGVARHASTHAAGVVVADKSLVSYTPLHRPTRGGDEGLPVTQYTMDVLEDTGLLKIDFLGLSTLTIMRLAADLIEERHGITYTYENIPLDDPETYRMLSSGQVTGIFQVESAGMRRVLTEMQPREFEHIVAAIALYRPGPLEFIPDYIAGMHGRTVPQYAHPALEPVLGETFGVCVYQEQLIRILTDVANYSPGEADLVRKAVSKKIKRELVVHRSQFVEGAVSHSGLDEAAANQVFDAFEYFARYGFNRAHSADYAVITVQTAFLKTHYPVEYMAALLTVERNNTEKVGLLIAECRRMGMEVLPPDVNFSGMDFTIEDEPPVSGSLDQEAERPVEGPAIRFGLGAIKNVGEGPVQAILDARETAGPFADLDDFCQRADLRQINRRALESLIKAGALRRFGTRAQLLAVIDRMLSVSQQAHGSIEQFTMFDMPAFADTIRLQADLPDVPEPPRREILAWEKDLVGVYVSEHPLSRLWPELESTVTVLTGQVDETMANRKVTLAGVVNHVRTHIARSGKKMAFAQIEDLQGTIELVIFPRTWEETQQLWEPECILVVRGRVSLRGREPSIIVDSATTHITTAQPVDAPWSVETEAFAPVELPPPNDAVDEVVAAPPSSPTTNSATSGAVQVQITVPGQGDVIQRLGQIYDLLLAYPGQDRVRLFVADGGRRRVQIDFPNTGVGYCLELKAKLRQLLGRGRVRVQEWVR